MCGSASRKIASFDLTSNMLPPPANLAGNNHHCVLALVHHAASDPLTATQTVTDLTSVGERKAAHKNLTVVQFTGTLPAPPPVVMVVRLHNPSVRKRLLTTLLVRLNGYPGRVRMYLPSLRLLGDLDKLAEGCKRGEDFDDFRNWSEKHIRFIEENQKSDTPYDKEWSQ
jgi:hypothetical protein